MKKVGWLCATMVLFCAACGLRDVRRNLTFIDQVAALHGEVRGTSEKKPVIIGLLREVNGQKTIQSYTVRYGAGPFDLRTQPGTVFLFALEDANESAAYEPGIDPSAWFGGKEPTAITVSPGAELNGFEITLQREKP